MPDIRRLTVNGTTYDIVSKTDTTLSQENFPADSKIVGDKLAEINAKIENINVSGGAQQVYNADTKFDFPSIGSIDCIYKAYKEKKIYQWNGEKMAYEPIEQSIEDFEISLINGGNANGI